MKKLMFIILGLLICVSAYAAPKWLPTVYSADTQVSTGSIIMHDASIYYAGVTAGDKMILSNGVAVGASRGTVFYTFVAPAANGSFYYRPEKDLVIDQGLYVDMDISGGLMGVGITAQ